MVESDARTAQTVAAAAEAKPRTLENRVRAGRLKDPAKIGAAAQRILASSGARQLFDIEIGVGRLLYHYNEDAHKYEELIAGRYVLAINPTKPTPPKSWTTTANCKQSKPASGSSETSYGSARCGTGPNNESAATSLSASTLP